jgi:hypothetical protein
MFLTSALWWRQSVLKSGTCQLSYTSCNKRSTKPLVWRNPMPKGALIVRPA